MTQFYYLKTKHFLLHKNVDFFAPISGKFIVMLEWSPRRKLAEILSLSNKSLIKWRQMLGTIIGNVLGSYLWTLESNPLHKSSAKI